MTAVFETVRGVRRKTPKGPHSVRKPRIRRDTGLVRAFGPIIGLQKIFREKVFSTERERPPISAVCSIKFGLAYAIVIWKLDRLARSTRFLRITARENKLVTRGSARRLAFEVRR
jgi:hypothetical protein